MPVTTGRAPTDNHRLVRLLRCVRGQLTFDVDIAPRFDYGRQPHEVRMTEGGFDFQSQDMRLAVHVVREPTDQHPGHPGDRGRRRARPGHPRGRAWSAAWCWRRRRPGRRTRFPVAEIERLFDDTAAFWRSWLARCQYTGRWREMVARSAITLKLMTYAPSGALVAAPTAGLPEQVGGERNWDYRYTWIRDASFSVYALLGLGFTEEAAAFTGWLGDRVKDAVKAGGRPLKIMYRVDGSTDLDEEILEHWEGYRGSSPVRIGNGAVDQLQLDIYGEALDCLHFADQRGLELDHDSWTALSKVLDWVADNWDQPEEGIWETRGGRQDFTYGRFMCWVALDRGVRLAAERGRPANVERWLNQRDTIYRQIMNRGWNTDRAGLRPALRHRRARLVACCGCPPSGSSPPRTRVAEHPAPRWTTSWSPTAWSTGTTRRPPRTGCAARRAPSRCARSGTSTPSPGPDASTTPGSSSRRCSPTPTTSAVLRGDRAHRRPDRQLPAGLHPPGPHQRRHHAQRPAGWSARPACAGFRVAGTALRPSL